MACSLCGKDDHNAKTCLSRVTMDIEKRDYTYWVKIDNITEEESREFTKEMVDVKQRIAPEGRATSLRAPKNQLPEHIKKLQIQEDNLGE